MVLTVHPSVPAQIVKELVALIRANAGKYSFASPGTGTPPHLVGELFRLSLDLDLVHVPFNGGGPAIGSTVAGHTPISFGAMAPAVPQIKDGKLRALAVTRRRARRRCRTCRPWRRPAIRRSRASSWTAVVVPAGTPKEIIAPLNREIARDHRAARHQGAPGRARLRADRQHARSVPEFFKTEMAKWSKVIRAAGIRAE